MKCLPLACALIFSITSSTWADDFKISDWTADHISLIKSRNSDGSAVSLSTDNPHSGKQCLKLSYNIQDVGYAEYNLNAKRAGPSLEEGEGTVTISFWMRGDPSVKLSPMALRVLDATGQVFQYPLPGSDATMQKQDWTSYTTAIDLDKSALHFAGAKDGVVHYPVTLLSVSLESLASGSNSGVVYLDDLEWERTAQ